MNTSTKVITVRTDAIALVRKSIADFLLQYENFRG